jgi:hypothetical protein
MKKTCALVLLCLALAASSRPVAQQQPPATKHPLSVGAAVRDITPKQEWLPLAGLAQTKLVGIIDPIHVRAIALGNGAKPSLIVTFEAGNPPEPKPFLTGLAEHTGVPIDAIYFGATHAHTTPSFTANPAVPSSKLYSDFVNAQILDAADAAIKAMRPATMALASTQSYISTNRQGVFHLADGTEQGTQGYNPAGPSDKTLTVVRFSDLTGKPIAFIVHYAVHNTVMYANRFNDQGTGISGDIGGQVSGLLEAAYPGSVANWLIGAAGDQNPLISNEYFTPNPVTGKQEDQFMKHANTELLEFYGKTQFADVRMALAKMDRGTDDAKVSYTTGMSTLPAYKDGDPDVPIGLSLLRIGDLALVGTSGELFNSTGVFMQSHSRVAHTLVSNVTRTYVEGAQPLSGYQPDDYALIHNGWHANMRRYKIGSIDGGYTTLMNKMIDATDK